MTTKCSTLWISQRKTLNEPCREIMVLFVLRKLILQTRMGSHPTGLDVWFLVWLFIYFHTSCVRTVKALARLHGCTGSPEPSLLACVISTIISWVGSNHLKIKVPTTSHTLNSFTVKILIFDRSVIANSVDPDQTEGAVAVWSGSTLIAIPSASFRKKLTTQILGPLKQLFFMSKFLIVFFCESLTCFTNYILEISTSIQTYYL